MLCMSSPSVKANTSLDSTLAYEDILLTCFAASGSPEGGTNMEIYTLLLMNLILLLLLLGRIMMLLILLTGSSGSID